MVTIVLIGLLGWAAGATINYLAEVLPFHRRIVYPFCLNCKAPFSLTNYFFAPRRCRACGRARPLRSWLVESVLIVSAIWLYRHPQTNLNFYIGLLLLIYFGVVVLIDIDYRVILHQVSLFGAAFGLAIGTLLHGLWATILGGIAGFGIMFLLYYLGVLFVRFLARRRGEEIEDALGFGDVNLAGVLGLILGWPLIGVGLILAVLLGGGISLVYLLYMILTRRYRSFVPIPYGPFMIASAVILLFFINSIASLF
jgi:leader peptidase (prepilin peptidase)/N-methyltransferase